jgi:hypothetical protein
MIFTSILLALIQSLSNFERSSFMISQFLKKKKKRKKEKKGGTIRALCKGRSRYWGLTNF